MTLSPHSPPSPEPVQEVAGEDGASIATVTSQGLATKFRDLGHLAEWQRACAKFKCPNTEVPTDEQLAALERWVRHHSSEDRRPEVVPAWTVMNWPELVTDYSDADDAQGLNLQRYVEKPSLEFVRRVVGLLKADKPTADQQQAAGYLKQSAPKKPSLADLDAKPATFAEPLEIEAELQAAS